LKKSGIRLYRMGGIKDFRMEGLRAASGFKKLGTGVNEHISAGLKQRHLGHYPEDLPRYQEQTVYVYDQGSDAAKLIGVLTSPASPNGAATILQAVAPRDEKVREVEAKLGAIRIKLVEAKDSLREMEEILGDSNPDE
jgi:hypothetical protein